MIKQPLLLVIKYESYRDLKESRAGPAVARVADRLGPAVVEAGRTSLVGHAIAGLAGLMN